MICQWHLRQKFRKFKNVFSKLKLQKFFCVIRKICDSRINIRKMLGK